MTHDIERLFNDADDGPVPAAHRRRTSRGTDSVILKHSGQRTTRSFTSRMAVASASASSLLAAKHVVGQSLGRLRPDSRQLAKLLDEPSNGLRSPAERVGHRSRLAQAGDVEAARDRPRRNPPGVGQTRSAASETAATISSSSISLSSSSISIMSGSMVTPVTLCSPDIFTRTAPPPAEPSTISAASFS